MRSRMIKLGGYSASVYTCEWSSWQP